MPSTTAAMDPVEQLADEVSRSRLPGPEDRRRIREGAKVPIRRAAKALGVAPMTFLRWERGETNLSIERALRYRQFLDALRRAANA